MKGVLKKIKPTVVLACLTVLTVIMAKVTPTPQTFGGWWSEYGKVKPAPYKEEVLEQRPGEPPLKKMPDTDASRDAAGRDQLFESIVVPNFTSIQEGMNGFAIADLNEDGLLDIIATYSPPVSSGMGWGKGEKLRVFINEGNFKFKEHQVKLSSQFVGSENFWRGQIPVLADFNKDGYLDLFVTRHAPMRAGRLLPRMKSIGNSLFVTKGSWDNFVDVSENLGVRNELAYNRQPSLGDVNLDGWLDIAIGCDNIKNAMGGLPHSRLYIFKPNGTRFEDGRFEDIGGTELVPDFGGFYHDSSKDKAGPDINLRDLDNDGDLDLIQSYHVDVSDPTLPYSPAEYRQGVFCWRNLLMETGEFRFEKVVGNGLACEARLKWNQEKRTYEAVGRAPGLPYLSFADVDNDGLLDVLAVGPASPSWAPRTEYITGRFWRNKGNFRFEEAMEAAGLSALNWTYREWFAFFEVPVLRVRNFGQVDPLKRLPYFGDAVFGDFNNDGWVDLVVLDRSEIPRLETRALFFLNRSDGTFEPKPTTWSGLNSSGICGEAADLNNDGLLDFIIAADPDNSGIALSMERYESKVYWNTGLHGAQQNHWLRLRFNGVDDANLIGARVEVREPITKKLLGLRIVVSDNSYKSGSPLEVHFGLGKHSKVDISVTLLDRNRTQIRFEGVRADCYMEVDLLQKKLKVLAIRKPS